MKRHVLSFSFLLLAGCMASNSLEYQAAAQDNQYRIARVQKGMDERQVLMIMHKPYSYESFVAGEDVYDVWFYVTKTTALDQTRMVPQNLTPLTFKNGVLVSTGYSWYYYAMREQAAEMAIRCPPPPKEPSQEQQDKEFEKNIREPVPQNVPQTTLNVEPPKQEVAKLIPPIATVQRQQFSQVQTGMTETEVTNLIGTPDSYTAYRIKEDIYDIWFYEVVSGFGQSKTLPLTFKNSVLVSTSPQYYKKIRQQAEGGAPPGYTREADRMQEDAAEQNFNFW